MCWRRRLKRLQEEFDRHFWCEELETYALALDANKKPCRVIASNAGHCLYSGIANRVRAYRIASRLMQPESFSGWGVRTVCSSSVGYNPVSYHNGSVWPHDNALIAAGMARYGFKEFTGRILAGLLELSVHVDFHRLPELICGLHQRPGEGPTLYPVACSPQAWSAAAVFLLLQACLGISLDAPNRRLTLHRPFLPDSLAHVSIRQLSLGEGSVDLLLSREGKGSEWRSWRITATGQSRELRLDSSSRAAAVVSFTFAGSGISDRQLPRASSTVIRNCGMGGRNGLLSRPIPVVSNRTSSVSVSGGSPRDPRSANRPVLLWFCRL